WYAISLMLNKIPLNRHQLLKVGGVTLVDRLRGCIFEARGNHIPCGEGLRAKGTAEGIAIIGVDSAGVHIKYGSHRFMQGTGTYTRTTMHEMGSITMAFSFRGTPNSDLYLLV